MSKVEDTEDLCHEIGHVIDWYLSSGKQPTELDIRERNADTIGNYLSELCLEEGSVK